MALCSGKKLTKYIALVYLLICASVQADDYLRPIIDFELLDQHNTVHTFEQYAQKEYLVLYVNGVGCPISRIAVPDFIKVQEQFANESMSFVMFNSSIQDSIKRISSEVDEFNIPFTVLKDADQSLGKALGIERTAEIFVIDTSTKQTVYRGPINDKLGYETQKNNASKNYLADALNATLAGESFNLDNIPESKGCLIAIF